MCPRSRSRSTTRFTCGYVLLGVVSWLIACGERLPQPPVRPNIVLISIDSLRSDHLGCYGYGRATSPTMDRLAEEGALFEVVTSSSSWTMPAHASLFTGLPEFVHGVDRSSRQLIPDKRTLAEAMQAAGYRTVGIWSNLFFDPQFGLDQGFEAYWSHRGASEDLDGAQDWDLRHALYHQDVTGPAILGKVDAALAGDDGRPLFLFVHLSDVHYDYVAPQPYGSMFVSDDYEGEVDGSGISAYMDRQPGSLLKQDLEHLIDLYDGEIAWVDHQVRRILASLEARGLTDETAIVVTAGHGEELFERGRLGHKHSLFDEVIRIPLVMRFPGRIEKGQRIDSPVGLIDIAPTLLEWAGAEPLPEILGRSVQPLLDGEVSDGSEVAVTELANELATEENLFALRTKGWKLVVRGKQREGAQLYDLLTDPDEQNNLFGVDDALTQTAEAQLQATLAELENLQLRHAQPRMGSGRLSEATERQLSSQGYFSEIGRAGTSIWADPNPIEICTDATSTFGKTTIIWNAVDAVGPVEIRVWPPGTIFGTHDIIGSKPTKEWVRDGLEFALVDTDSGEEIGRTRISVVQVDCSNP